MDANDVTKALKKMKKPRRGTLPAHSRIPLEGLARKKILKELKILSMLEGVGWKNGLVSGAVYHGDNTHISFLNEVYGLTSQTNPLHADVWPSVSWFEAEIVAMTANLLGGREAKNQSGERVCGTVSSGGTESILLAMKAYRDWARDIKGIKNPEIVAPTSAHAAFDKAAEYLDIKIIRVPVDRNFRADIDATKNAVSENTAVIVGSAPSFPHGVIDPIEELSQLAKKKGIGFHTDACLGGFLLPWAEKLGHAIPPFDFRLPGVTSISADTHKYGYAAKGTSVILYRSPALRRYQYFTVTDWPGGLYFSPTIAGSRSGALSAMCWAALLKMGERGYLETTEKILATASFIRKGIEAIPELTVLGDPLWVIAFSSEELDIYRVLEEMTKRGWGLNGLHKPPAIHICVTLRHTQRGLAERFLSDLRETAAAVKANPQEKGEMAPLYGIAATFPARGVVSDILKQYIDLLYELDED